jgi:[acyl-carrier-protein] S-malonyltransferase
VIAVLFPGQGSQELGMGVALRAASRAAEHVFLAAEEITGIRLRELCETGPAEELTRTSVAQPAIVATSLATAAHLKEILGFNPVAPSAGHSVGELAAMCWTGALDLEATLALVHERGRLMERDSAAVDGTMVAVLGLTRADLETICNDVTGSSDEKVQVANCNAPGQVALSGERAAIERASQAAMAAGARRVLPLSVGGPFHSVYMEAASTAFKNAVAAARIDRPRAPVVLNTTATASDDPRILRDELSTQITRPVLWEDSVLALAAMGCDTFLELGAGKVLSGLVRRTLPEATVLSAGTPETIQEAAKLFAAAETAG